MHVQRRKKWLHRQGHLDRREKQSALGFPSHKRRGRQRFTIHAQVPEVYGLGSRI